MGRLFADAGEAAVREIGLLELYATTFEPRWFVAARELGAYLGEEDPA